MKQKKAQELPLSTLIIAIIVILVLVISVFIIINGTTKFQKSTKDCEAQSGKCIKNSVGCASDEIKLLGICDEGYVCCIPQKT